MMQRTLGMWPAIAGVCFLAAATVSAGGEAAGTAPAAPKPEQAAPAAGTAPGTAQRDVSLLLESKAAADRALRYLKGTQKPDGSWQGDPAITGLVVTAMVGSGQEDMGPESEIVGKALSYIRSFAKPNGGIYGNFYPSYTTSICAMALLEAGLPEDRDLLKKARSFLLESQADESQDIAKSDPQYGGWGYEKDASGAATHRPDLSNTQFALETLKNLEAVAQEDVAAAGTGQNAQTRTELAYDRAIVFLQRCQNLKAYNDQPWATNDGGFVYKPGESKAGEDDGGGLRSYGGMTYAGLKSMIYARLKKDDPRVVAAFDWIRRHWTVTENPELGEQGLYYYYLTMARALSAYGVEAVVDAQGRSHDWRRELVAQLLKVQRADGSWANTNGRWMEQIPDLTTAYCLLAIENASRKW